MRRLLLVWLLSSSTAEAHFSGFKSPGPGMHFTDGEPLVVFADLFDDRDGKGFIVCPAGQTISNQQPVPDYSTPRVAQCSGGATPVGWPQLQLLVDGVLQLDGSSGSDTVPNTISFDHNLNSNPIGYFRFVAQGIAPGMHQIVARGRFSVDGVSVDTQDSAPIAFFVDARPAMTVLSLDAGSSTGTIDWENVIVVGNGRQVTASGALTIKHSLVTGIAGLSGSVSSADLEGSIFEDSGPLQLTLGSGAVVISDNEWRANNRLTFVADDPSVPLIVDLNGSGSNQKLFQGNRVGAGQSSFGGQSWLIGGDTDDLTNIFIGPRCVLDVKADHSVIRGNYAHHNYRGAWSQGYNFDYYSNPGSDVLTEHNFIRDGSWPVQSLAGEFRYNVVYGYGHNWIRSASPNASIHHNLFTPGGDGGLSAGIQCYLGETGLSIYNNTFDGGGASDGDFAGATIDMSGGSQVLSLRNNLVTFSRNQQNDSPGADRVTGGSASYAQADYNAFYSPDNDNMVAYDFSGAGAHDVGAVNGQLAATPFAGARILDPDRVIASVVDEAAVWQRTQTLSYVLAAFRARYTPVAGSPIIDSGDPADNDSKGRRADIGAIDLDGHDQDKLGKFGAPPSELTPPTVTLTAPAANALLTGSATVSASADDHGGSGVVLVQFLVDGATVAQIAASPYSTSFDTSVVPNGAHAFAAKAWDAAGNFAISAPVMAETMNAHAGPPDGGALDAAVPDGATPGMADGGSVAVSPPDGATHDLGPGGVKAGCACAVGGASTGSGPSLVLILAGMLFHVRRRHARSR